MTAQPPTGTAAENSSPTEEASETLREAFMKQISGDPQFREARKSGKAYVIAGDMVRVGSFKTADAAKAAAQKHYDANG
jgi:hypothetical protein